MQKTAQKEYSNKHDRVGNVIYWELCKILKSPRYTQTYKHKLVLNNETHYIPWNFQIQTDHQIQQGDETKF